VVGWAYTAEERVIHAFPSSDEGLLDLGSLGGSSEAHGVNDAGVVVGWSGTAEPQTTHAFVYRDGAMTDLGTFGGRYSEAFAVNDAGQVVGYADLANNRSHAFLYEGDELIDLNDLLPEGSGWTLESAAAINNAGQIVGRGRNPGGFPHAYLLTPDDGPAPRGKESLAIAAAPAAPGTGTWSVFRQADPRPTPPTAASAGAAAVPLAPNAARSTADAFFAAHHAATTPAPDDLWHLPAFEPLALG
jgi:probable HAF family extracellular repeat protein